MLPSSAMSALHSAVPWNCRGAARTSHKAHREGTCGLAALSRGRALQEHCICGAARHPCPKPFAAAARASVTSVTPLVLRALGQDLLDLREERVPLLGVKSGQMAHFGTGGRWLQRPYSQPEKPGRSS